MRKELIGHEGGNDPVILLVFRRPWGVYFTVRSRWTWQDGKRALSSQPATDTQRVSLRHSLWRFRLVVGPRFKFTLHIERIGLVPVAKYIQRYGPTKVYGW